VKQTSFSIDCVGIIGSHEPADDAEGILIHLLLLRDLLSLQARLLSEVVVLETVEVRSPH
jgi:hypothetical protein